MLSLPYTLENLAKVTSAVLAVPPDLAMRNFKVYYKENGNEIPISSDSELSGFIFKSIPASDIYVWKVWYENSPIRGNEKNNTTDIKMGDKCKDLKEIYEACFLKWFDEDFIAEKDFGG